MSQRKTHAHEGGWIGCILGLLTAWYIMANTFDYKVTDRSDKFAFAAMLVYGFAVFCFLFLAGLGYEIGELIRRKDSDGSQE